MKVLVTTSSFGKNSREPLELLSSKGFKCILNPYCRKLTEEELIFLINEYTPDYLIAGVEQITPKALSAMACCVRMISICGAGLDGVDLDYARTMGISIANTPDAPTAPVAELTLGIMLDLLRKITCTDRSIRRGEFERPMGNLLEGKTIGIIGCGRIGTHLAGLLEPFKCKITGYDKALKKHSLIELKPFDDVVKEADILTVHIPFDAENTHIIDKDVLSKMKKDAYFINVSRRGIVKDEDLIEVLKERRISGAGIECYENDDFVKVLSKFNNVVLTSHIGPFAKEARVIQEMDAVNNILKML